VIARLLRQAWTAVVVAALSASACSNSSSTPTTPSETTPTTSITPADTVHVLGDSWTFTLTSTTTTPTNVIWISSNPNVLIVDGSGRATAVGVGASTVTANADGGITANLTIQVVPVYQGAWTGTTRVLACTDVDGFQAAGYCASTLGTSSAVALTLSQSAATVSGTLSKTEADGTLSGSVSGTIGASGDITLKGTLNGTARGSAFQLTLISWNSLATGQSMTGSWSATVTSPQSSGLATVQWLVTLRAGS